MKKIVKGNDFTLRIPVMKMVEGQPQAFPLPACTDVVVQVCNLFKRIPLALEMYALECFNVTASHKAAVGELKSIEEVKAYDYKAGYPKMLEMSV